ncbi:MAG: hypothetical protein ABJD11_10595 [Gemmatimonadota bacterium]
MSESSNTAALAARQLWDGHHGDDASASDHAAAAERAMERLRGVLVRWIGLAGYQALLQRALEDARPRQAILGSVRLEGGKVTFAPAANTAAIGSTNGSRNDNATGTADGREIGDGVLELATALIVRLTRVVGEDMALRLVEQAWPEDGPPVGGTVNGDRPDA